MDTLSTILCLVLTIITLIVYSFKKRYAYWKNRGVPYVEPRIPLGTIPFRKAHFKDITSIIYDQRKSDVPFVGGFIFRSPILVATDLDFVQMVLVKEFGNFHGRGMYVNEADDPLSGHMFSLDGEKWKSIRSKLTPTFTSGKMKMMFQTVVDVADRFHSILSKEVGQESQLEIKDWLARFTTDVIGSCAFGIECNSLENPKSDFRSYSSKVFQEPHLNILLQFLVIIYPNLARKLHIRTTNKDVSDFFMGTVRATIDFRKKNNIRRNDFMDLLIQLKDSDSFDDEHSKKLGALTLEEIAAQAFLFFIAGFETSSTTMLFSLYELALNQDIQEKARNEIESVLRQNGGKLTYDAVKEMVYVDQIISETLRKYPPVVNLIRVTDQDFQVPDTNITIEKGIPIFIPAFSIHRDPEVYEDPDVFDPERFSPEQIKARHPMSFLGFGDGPRNCVGLRFGRMQSRIGLITLLRNYKFKPCPKTPIPMVFAVDKPMLTSKNEIYLSLEKI